MTQIAFHPGGMIATAGAEETIRFWDFATRRELHCFRWKIGPIEALVYSPDGMRCAAGGANGRIVVWDVE